MFANRMITYESIYKHILNSKKNKSKLFALLVDPDKQDKNDLLILIEKSI